MENIRYNVTAGQAQMLRMLVGFKSRRGIISSIKRHARVAAKVGITPEQLREAYIDRWCTVMTNVDFCKYLMQGKLLVMNGTVVAAKGF